MTVFFIVGGIIGGILLLIFLLYIDFYFGRKNHQKHKQILVFPVTTGDYQFYQLGSTLFDDLLQDIKNAKHEVSIQFFIVKKDMLSTKLFTLLEEKAKEGVTVRFLVDRIGGFRISGKYRDALKNAGVHFSFSGTPSFPYFFYNFNRRNHRKITIIDGKIAYVGGFNIGDEYEGRSPVFNTWRDYHVRLTGKIVHDVQKIFQHDWEQEKKDINLYRPGLKDEVKEVQALATEGFGLEESFLKFIQTAEKEICIGSPYFIPTKAILQELEQACKRGVHIKLLVPMKADHPFVKEAGIPYYFFMKKIGAEVRLFDQGFFHGKLFILDDKLCNIGTANFDYRSLFTNKEVNLLFYDRDFISNVKKSFLDDFNDSYEVSEDWYRQLSIWTKIKMKLSRFIRPLL